VTGDVPVPADYDGDGKADIAVWRPVGQYWYVANGAIPWNTSFGWSSADVPVPADYDGDGKADIAFWSVDWQQQGYWNIRRSLDGTVVQVAYGIAGDIPIPADYDGDGKADIAVWRPSTGEWFILNSNSPEWRPGPFGSLGDVPVPADYDGDGLTDLSYWANGAQSASRITRESSTAAVNTVTWGSSYVLELPWFDNRDPPAPVSAPYLAAAWYWDTYGNIARVELANSGVVNLPTYTYQPFPHGWLHLVWAVPALGTHDIDNIALAANWQVGLSINGVKLQRYLNGLPKDGFYVTDDSNSSTYGCPTNVPCLGTSVAGDDLGVASPWNLNLLYELNAGGQITNVTQVQATVTTTPIPLPPEDYFGYYMLPIFRDPRCSTCHSLGDDQAINTQHFGLADGYLRTGSVLNQAGTGPGHVLDCTNSCHFSRSGNTPGNIPPGIVPGVTLGLNDTTGLQLRWLTPAFDEGLNWSTMTPHQICTTVLRNLPTKSAVAQHFSEDGRVAWAVNDGELPNDTVLPTAYPHSYAALQSVVTGWIASNMVCPP
jgi:hypothetical protein